MTAHHDAALQDAKHTSDTHTQHLCELHHHLEDLDNRGRCHNLCVRGLPEAVEPGQLTQAVLAIFDKLLERPQKHQLKWRECIRLKNPRGRDTDPPPRDIVCCIANFRLKEEILPKARNRSRILYHGAEIKLYQDLSHITLQHRKHLRPLL